MRSAPRALRLFLIALGAVAGILALATLAVPALIDVDSYKPQVEAAASTALGMEVTVEGPLRIRLLPALRAVAGNVRVRNRGSELAWVESAELDIRILPLLRRELRYTSITLKRARISIERGRDGRYNYQKPPGVVGAFRALELEQVSLPNLVIAYADKASGAGFESRDCSGELTQVRHPGGAPFLMRVSLSGKLACGEVRGKETAVSDLRATVEARDGVFDFKPVTMRLAGGKGVGSLRMDRSAAVPVLHLEYALSKFRIEEFARGLPPGKSLTGSMDFSTTLAMRGRTRGELRQGASGRMSLSGTNLTLSGVDLDKAFSSYTASQNFNLLDLGAFLLVGPFGLVVTKGYEFAALAGHAGGSTPIRSVVSRWKVEKGVAHAEDVALATGETRLALQGGLDFVDGEFDEVFVALIDAKGCASVRQRIRGPFGKPVVEKPSVLASVAGPVVNLLGKARDLLPGTGPACEVFYSGSMPPPA
jgi:hypothetical protein